MNEDKYHFFYKGPFSQWFKRKFTVAGIEYNCMEQYMMAHKALCFNDMDRYEFIMGSNSPWDHKLHGRMVTPYDDAVWSAARFNIVVEGGYHKFSQHEDLKQLLIDTGDKIIVEASPIDPIWGIGIGMDDPKRFDETKWAGQNLLGKALMQNRKKICLNM